jgi:hypothetical protein
MNGVHWLDEARERSERSMPMSSSSVIPAEAGISARNLGPSRPEAPACAGATIPRGLSQRTLELWRTASRYRRVADALATAEPQKLTL